jgi:hypothetical protein
LRNDMLEALRLLISCQMDAENRLCLLLHRLTELRPRVRMAVHESLAQRIVVRHHLTGLTVDELPAHLAHHVGLAGRARTYPGARFVVAASEGLDAEARRNLEVIWLLNGRVASYHTIADFRKDHAKALERHRARMQDGQAKMRERAGLCEHPFGTFKRRLG